MPTYTSVDLDYVPFSGGNPVFVAQQAAFAPSNLRKRTPAIGRDRQEHFHREIGRLAKALGVRAVPIFVQWRNSRNRMDKGCVGHAVAAGLITVITDNRGMVTHVQIMERTNAS